MTALMNLAAAPLTMTSREIAELTGKNHADVMRDIRNMVEQLTKAEMLSCAKSTTYTGKDGRQYPQYELDKDTCLTLLLGYDAVARMKVVKRWQELEAGAPAAIDLRDPKQMATVAVQLLEVNRELQEQVQAMTPKVEALTRIALSEGSLCIQSAAKHLQVQPNFLFKWLQEHQWIYRRAGGGGFLGYQSRIQSGLLEHKVTTVSRSDGTEKVVEQCRITPRGLAKLAEMLAIKDAA